MNSVSLISLTGVENINSFNDCFDVVLTTKRWAEEITWSIGSCRSSQSYMNFNVFTQQCCLADGDYKIKCQDSYADGWHGGYLEINGQKYCEDFTGSLQETDLTIGALPTTG